MGNFILATVLSSIIPIVIVLMGYFLYYKPYHEENKRWESELDDTYPHTHDKNGR